MIQLTVRPMPTLTTPSNAEGWDWDKVKANLKTCNIISFYVLMFRPWKTVLAPKHAPCYVTNLHGDPLYEFKEWRGSTYQLRPQAGIGFPGS